MFKKDIISGASQGNRQHIANQAKFSIYQAVAGRSEQRREHLGLSDYKRHQRLLKSANILKSDEERPRLEDVKSDYHLLCESFQFLYEDEELEGERPSSTGERLAIAYYNCLLKEYVLCDLSQYKEGKIGMRWRTEPEVIKGKGQFECGSINCDKWVKLASYEVLFRYEEGGKVKENFVKARLCPKCAKKLERTRSQFTKVSNADDEPDRLSRRKKSRLTL